MANQRKFFVGGNWKLNGSKQSIDEIVKFLNEGSLDKNTGNFNWPFMVSWMVFNGDLHKSVYISCCSSVKQKTSSSTNMNNAQH